MYVVGALAENFGEVVGITWAGYTDPGYWDRSRVRPESLKRPMDGGKFTGLHLCTDSASAKKEGRARASSNALVPLCRAMSIADCVDSCFSIPFRS